MTEKLYARRDPEAQGEHYWRHLDAMTREKLFDKCAIAQELAHRDMEIERLRAALASVVKQIDQHDEHYSDPRCYYQCGWDWDLLSAEAVLAEPQPLPARDQEHDGHDGHL